MTSQQIQYFLSAAKHLSFTKAAEEFYTSQPTISRQIAALEDELGFELFYREGKQLRLTSGGLVMLAEFSQQQSALQSAIQRVEQIQSGFEGSLSIGFLTSFDTDIYVYPPSMAFSARYPNITIKMDSASFAPLRQRLYDGEYDIIFTWDSTNLIRDEGVDYRLQEKVQLVGFGSFEVKNRAERLGRNPQTGEPVPVPPSKSPVFKAAKSLKDAVNN